MTSIVGLERPTTRRPVIYRPESAVFWVFVVALGVGIVSVLADMGNVFSSVLNAHVALAPLWLAFVGILVWVMLKFDPYRAVRAYPQMLLAAAALGGTTAIAIAMQGLPPLDQLYALVLPPETLGEWSAALTAPIIEEAAKAACAALILVLCASVCTRPAHALLVGMFTGFGFDVVEDLSYAGNQAVTSLDSDLSGASASLVIRAMTAFPAHWSYTGAVAVGILLLLPSFANPGGWSDSRRITIAVGLMAAGPAMHFIWNSPLPASPQAVLLGMMLKIVVNVALFLTIAIAVVGTERRWVATRTASLGDVDPALLASVASRRAGRRLRKSARRDQGRGGARRVRRERNELLDRIQATG